VVQDLLDTLKANEAHCVGMAANMIGVKKQKKKYSGWIAQIIQHEVDHLSGIII
jgi:peptide deformylase